MDQEAKAHEHRELLIDELCELPVQDFTLAQLHRLSKALENARKILGDRVVYCPSEFEALTGAHAVVIATEWNEYRNLDLERARGIMASPALVDLRNLVEPEEARARGFAYDGVGYPGS